MKPTKLQLEIQGKNELNKLAKHVLTELMPLLTPFLNKKLFTAKGLTEKAKQTIDLQKLMKSINLTPLKDGHFCEGHRCYIESSYNSLKLHLAICLNGGSYDVKPVTAYCQYFENTFYIGKTSDKDYTILSELANINTLLTEYELNNSVNLEEEIKKINEFKDLKEKLEKVKRSIKLPEDVYKYM